MEFPANTLFATGRARLQANNPIAVRDGHLLMVAVIDEETGRILKTETNSICSLTSEFISGIMTGKSLYTDQELICGEIEQKYFGSSKKALCSCVKDMVSKAASRIKE